MGMLTDWLGSLLRQLCMLWDYLRSQCLHGRYLWDVKYWGSSGVEIEICFPGMVGYESALRFEPAPLWPSWSQAPLMTCCMICPCSGGRPLSEHVKMLQRLRTCCMSLIDKSVKRRRVILRVSRFTYIYVFLSFHNISDVWPSLSARGDSRVFLNYYIWYI